MGYGLGVPPTEALATIVFIDGELRISAQLMLALICRSGQLVRFEIEGNDPQCTVTMARPGQQPYTETLSIEDVQPMRIWDRAKGQAMAVVDALERGATPKSVLQWQTIVTCARAVFPDIIGGTYPPCEITADDVMEDDWDEPTLP